MALLSVSTTLGCSRLRGNLEREPDKSVAKTEVTGAPGTNLTDKDGAVLADVAARALPAVVSVASTRVARLDTPELDLPDFFRRFFGPPGGAPFPELRGEPPVQRGLGSGVLVRPDVVLTNAHVVEDATEIVVTAGDKRVLKAKLAGSDPKSDLAVLRITSDTSGLTPLAFGDSSTLRLGQIVLAIGYPFGLGGTVTMGIVSATGRANLGIVAYEDFIQTDAAINPGNSGGALIDLQGRLVGIPTAILSRSGGYMGVGFAIPSNMAQPIMNSLLEHGRVTRGFLGVTIQELDEELAQALGLPANGGVLIAEVSPGAPADQAGLRRGDVVTAIDGKQVRSTGEFRNLIAAAGAKKTVVLELTRAGKRETVRVTLAAAPEERRDVERREPDARQGPAGLRLAPLDATLRKRLEVPPSFPGGAVVVEVDPASPAARAGLRPGDVIVEAGKVPIASPEALAELLTKSKDPIALLVIRAGHAAYVVLKR